MQVKMDDFGRIVIPKEVRDRFELHSGSRLDVEETPEGLLFKPVEADSGLVWRNGQFVVTGPLTGMDCVRLVHEDREARIKQIWRSGSSTSRG